MMLSISENRYDQLIDAGWASVVCDNNYLPSYDSEHDSRAKAPYCDSAEERWIKCLGHKLTKGLPLLVYPYFDPKTNDETIIFPQRLGEYAQQAKVVYKCWGEINGLTKATFGSDLRIWLTTPPVIGLREMDQRPVFLKLGKGFEPDQIEKKVADYQQEMEAQLFSLAVRIFKGQLPGNVLLGKL